MSHSNNPYKILTLGNSMVGKTSLITKYVDNKFHDSYLSTIGIDYQTKIIEYKGEQVQFNIWDSAGQEKYRSISKQYYKKSDAVILTFDLSSQESFQSIDDWFKEVKDQTKNNILIVLNGNKSDLPDDVKTVSKTEAQKFANNNNLKYFETSAKTGEGVNELFGYITISLIKDSERKKNNPTEKITGTIEDISDIRSGNKEKKQNCCDGKSKK